MGYISNDLTSTDTCTVVWIKLGFYVADEECSLEDLTAFLEEGDFEEDCGQEVSSLKKDVSEEKSESSCNEEEEEEEEEDLSIQGNILVRIIPENSCRICTDTYHPDK